MEKRSKKIKLSYGTIEDFEKYTSILEKTLVYSRSIIESKKFSTILWFLLGVTLLLELSFSPYVSVQMFLVLVNTTIALYLVIDILFSTPVYTRALSDILYDLYRVRARSPKAYRWIYIALVVYHAFLALYMVITGSLRNTSLVYGYSIENYMKLVLENILYVYPYNALFIPLFTLWTVFGLLNAYIHYVIYKKLSVIDYLTVSIIVVLQVTAFVLFLAFMDLLLMVILIMFSLVNKLLILSSTREATEQLIMSIYKNLFKRYHIPYISDYE